MTAAVEGPTIFFVMVKPPLDHRNERGSVWPRLQIAVHIKPYLDIASGSNNDSWNKTRKLAQRRLAVKFNARVQLAIDLSFIHHVRRRNVKDRLLSNACRNEHCDQN